MNELLALQRGCRSTDATHVYTLLVRSVSHLFSQKSTKFPMTFFVVDDTKIWLSHLRNFYKFCQNSSVSWPKNLQKWHGVYQFPLSILANPDLIFHDTTSLIHLFHFYPQQFTSCSGLSVSHDILTWFVLLTHCIASCIIVVLGTDVITKIVFSSNRLWQLLSYLVWYEIWIIVVDHWYSSSVVIGSWCIWICLAKKLYPVGELSSLVEFFIFHFSPAGLIILFFGGKLHNFCFFSCYFPFYTSIFIHLLSSYNHETSSLPDRIPLRSTFYPSHPSSWQ